MTLAFVHGYTAWVAIGVFVTTALFSALAFSKNTGGLSGKVAQFLTFSFIGGLAIVTVSGSLPTSGFVFMQPLNIGNLNIASLGLSGFSASLLFTTSFLVLLGMTRRLLLAETRPVELSLLLAFSLIGSLSMIYTDSLLDTYLSLELVAFATFAQVALERQNRDSIYGGIQYVVSNAIPTGMILLGVALEFGRIGSLSLSEAVLLQIWGGKETSSLFSLLGAADIGEKGETFPFPLFVEGLPLFDESELIGTGRAKANIGKLLVAYGMVFKVGLAPLHRWALMVYPKAPVPVFLMLSTVSKVVIVMLLLKLWGSFFLSEMEVLSRGFLLVAFASTIIGTLGAIGAKNLKRYLTYAAIGHTSYLVFGLLNLSEWSYVSISLYLAVYVVSSVSFWGLLLTNRYPQVEGGESADRTRYSNVGELSLLAGLKERNLLTAFSIVVVLLSMSALPPFAGFYTKIDILMSLIDRADVAVVAFILCLGIPSLYYYLRVAKIILFEKLQQTAKMNLTKGNFREAVDFPMTLSAVVLGLGLVFYLLFVEFPLLDSSLVN